MTFLSPGSRMGGGMAGRSQTFPSGTTMLFYQANAPMGWTKVTTQNDKALRVVSGSGGVSGGTNSFSTVMAQTVVGSSSLSTAQLAIHQHTLPGGEVGTNGPTNTAAGGGIYVTQSNGTNSSTADANTGSGSTHNHTITMAIQYIDLILASKK